MTFEFADGTRLERPDPAWDEPEAEDATHTRLSRLLPSEQFAYEFDFGDSWIQSDFATLYYVHL